MRNLITLNSYGFSYRNFGRLCFDPFEKNSPPTDASQLKNTVSTIFDWAKANGARYYSFLAFPHTDGVAEKQECFLGVGYEKHNLIKHCASEKLSINDMLKGEADGSSFPNGGLRQTHLARGYFIWDWRSQLFIKKSNNCLYIPSLLVNHHGQALDDKTTYRKAQNLIQKECLQLLKNLNIQATGIFIGLGLQQQFFLLPRQQYLKRLDLTQTGRTLFGVMPPHHQQLSDHYYAKIEPKVEQVLKQAQDQLVQMGIPIKTRHKQVAPNQYQICSVFEEASRAIDHNLIKTMVMEEVCAKHGFVPLWHEKPFRKINGSGKHMNWSLNYFDKSGKLNNLYSPNGYNDDIFLLFALIKLKAVLSNQQLYLSAICVPGNQLRLGGHEAPPRIFSAFLGQTVSNMIERLPQHKKSNLRDKINHLIVNLDQEDTDRNRTSPYAYTSNRFQFRAVGSSQNCYFPMTVILTTIAKQMQEVNKKIKSGASIKDLINQLTKQTDAIRFDGDGYSPKWVQQAKSRNLYVNSSFTQNILNLKTSGSVLTETGVYSPPQLLSKSNISTQIYIKTVQIESKTLQLMLNKNIIPRLYNLLSTLPRLTTSEALLARSRKIESLLERVVVESEGLEKSNRGIEMSVKEAEALRARVGAIGELLDQVCGYLPADLELPEIYEMMGKM